MDKKIAYKEAGVDIDAGNKFVQSLKTIVKRTKRPEVLSNIGGFGGLFALNIQKNKNPVLVSSTDGVGTKLRVAFMMNRHDTIGIDLVAMCVNDIIVQGAEPLFMLDYISTGKIDQTVLENVVQGIAAGCKEAGCALIGGETAEMPSFYKEGEYDVAGFVIGVVEKNEIIDGSSITVGDKIIGIASSGIHSNGLSLARYVIFDKLGMKPDKYVKDLGCTVGEELLKPTRIYAKTFLNLFRDFQIHGIANITGGGLDDNIARILPRGCLANIHLGCWDVPPIFDFIKDKGNISDEEMLRTFNNGIGMVIVVPAADEEEFLLRLKGLKEKAFVIGEIESKSRRKRSVAFSSLEEQQ
jgi:phosphoribosylformylglycinamidine cyclo-ligase